MVISTVGTVVLVRFPFSDLSASKLRPAVVLAEVGGGDWILAQVTSNPYGDPWALEIAPSDLVRGSLQVSSFVRPGKLFTAHANIVTREVAMLTTRFHRTLIERVTAMLSAGVKP